MKKSIFNNILKWMVVWMSFIMLAACSSYDSQDWPTLEADTVWQNLEQNPENKDISSANIESDDLLPGPSPLLDHTPASSLKDIRASLNDIERALGAREDQLKNSIDLFENSPEEDRYLYWGGVEIEISRLNELVLKLRDIEYQISDHKQAIVEHKFAQNLIARAQEIMLSPPPDLLLR